MKFIAINTKLTIKNHEVIHTTEQEFYKTSMGDVDYLIVSGGDGLLRRIIQDVIFSGEKKPKIIIDAQGSFNVIAKRHLIPKISKILAKIEAGEELAIKNQAVYKLNKNIFLFSAGNMYDALHIHLAEILRIGFLKKGALKYLVSSLFVLPIFLLTYPFLMFSKKRFFIYTPFKLFNFMNFYTKIDTLKIDLQNPYNIIEIDGDIVFIEEQYLKIEKLDDIKIVVG